MKRHVVLLLAGFVGFTLAGYASEEKYDPNSTKAGGHIYVVPRNQEEKVREENSSPSDEKTDITEARWTVKKPSYGRADTSGEPPRNLGKIIGPRSEETPLQRTSRGDTEVEVVLKELNEEIERLSLKLGRMDRDSLEYVKTWDPLFGRVMKIRVDYPYLWKAIQDRVKSLPEGPSQMAHEKFMGRSTVRPAPFPATVFGSKEIDRRIRDDPASLGERPEVHSYPTPVLTPLDYSQGRQHTNQPRTKVGENDSYYGEPNSEGRPKTVHVQGYTRKDGTYVTGHYRTVPRQRQPRTKVGENDSYYGEPNSEGRPQTVHVQGYTRKDGTYVTGHYRAAPRR